MGRGSRFYKTLNITNTKIFVILKKLAMETLEKFIVQIGKFGTIFCFKSLSSLDNNTIKDVVKGVFIIKM